MPKRFKNSNKAGRRNYSKHIPGQGLVEYALLLGLICVVVVVVLLTLGPQVGNVYSNVKGNFNGNNTPAVQTTNQPITTVAPPVVTTVAPTTGAPLPTCVPNKEEDNNKCKKKDS
jgi:Flp pilus assembly pilin Flp